MRQAGQITSAAELPLAGGSRTFALGMIRSEAETRNEPLTISDRWGDRDGADSFLTAKV